MAGFEYSLLYPISPRGLRRGLKCGWKSPCFLRRDAINDDKPIQWFPLHLLIKWLIRSAIQKFGALNCKQRMPQIPHFHRYWFLYARVLPWKMFFEINGIIRRKWLAVLVDSAARSFGKLASLAPKFAAHLKSMNLNHTPLPSND